MLVGSYPQPQWLVDPAQLISKGPPRIRNTEVWRIPDEFLEQAQDDATLLAIRDQERAGLDFITDGEIRRESYSNRFATALDGVDVVNFGVIPSRTGRPSHVPRIVGKICRKRPVEVHDVKFLRTNTDKPIKITLPGPFTMSQQAKDEFYNDEEAVVMDYALAVNEEVRDLFAAGANIVQLDEPYMQAAPDKARAFGIRAVDRALAGATGTTAIHLCFGYASLVKDKPNEYAILTELENSAVDQVSIETAQPALDLKVLERMPSKTIVIGVIDLSKMEIETPQQVADRIMRAVPHVSPERIVVAPDCGLKYLPRDIAYGKMKAMVEGAALARENIGR